MLNGKLKKDGLKALALKAANLSQIVERETNTLSGNGGLIRRDNIERGGKNP
jgi:hypothetical protein